MSIIQRGKVAKVSKERKAELEEVLSSWQTLVTGLNDLTIPELEKAIFIEFKGKKRRHMLDRLIGRRNKLENLAFREELGLRKAA